MTDVNITTVIVAIVNGIFLIALIAIIVLVIRFLLKNSK